MNFDFFHSHADSPAIHILALGLELKVRLPLEASSGGMTIIETFNAPGFGPPLHCHYETGVFHVQTGRDLFEVDGECFEVGAGDVIAVPGGNAHGFVNITSQPASQFILILAGLDASAFNAMKEHKPDSALLKAFGIRWGVEFLGPQSRRHDPVRAYRSPARDEASVEHARDNPGQTL
jgi:quercetin dioxygenase-like cupin family protein